MTINESIYKIIKEKNLKQSAVAKSAGYGIQVFNNMVKGRRKIYADDIPNICRVLCVSANELFQNVGDSSNENQSN